MIPYSMDYMRRQLRVCIYARVSTEHEAQISALETLQKYNNPAERYAALAKMPILLRAIDEGKK